MAGEYYGYYDREGKGKRKKYRCLLCNHKLPTLSGITSHLSRSHSEEISESKRRLKEWKKNQQRKKQEEEDLVKFTVDYEDPFTREVSPLKESTTEKSPTFSLSGGNVKR